MTVDTLLGLDPLNIPTNLTITGASITTSRLLKAMQQAFANVVVFKGTAQSYACDECDSEDIVDATVYVDSTNDTLIGVHWSGTLTTGEPYLRIVLTQLKGIQDFYIGETVSSILTMVSIPMYPNFNATESGATISFVRLHQALLNALGESNG
jgi:hypothetical protein